ncbi:MAG: GCN5-related N-acetyltransferase [Thermoplasmatales archaeon I-plasma]|jgi:ribosomal protein S18 acetylase RimI-like enzyme|nr:MAG: GCN5-related N-acetyltransferase [Thermoplasmatales archaeon I-plasma]
MGSIKDIDDIAKVENRAFGSHAYDYSALKYMLGIANSITTVATVDGSIVGYASIFFRKNSKISHLESIAVDPEFQNAGIGRMLMDEVERISLEKNCSLIVLETFEKNVSALKLYERSGFKAKEVVQDYYHIPFDGSRNAIRFEKKIK